MAKKKSKQIKSLKVKEHRLEYYFPLVCVIIGLGIVLRLLFPIMQFEMAPKLGELAPNICNREFWGLFNPLDYSQVAPPLFLSLVKLCTIILPTEDVQTAGVVMRLVPLSAGILSIFAFYQLLKNIFVNRFVILSGLVLFAFNPMLINYSYQLNPCSTDVLVCTLLVLYFIRYNPEGYWRRFWQILLLSFSIMLSFPAAFVILAGIVWTLFNDYRKFFYAASAFILFCVFYFVFHLWGVMEANGAALDGLWSTFFVSKYTVLSLATLWVQKDFNVFILPWASLSLLGAGLVCAGFRDKKVMVLSLVTVLSVLSASYLHLYAFSPETCVFLIPFAILLTCQIPDLISERVWVSKLFPIVFSAISFYLLYLGLFH